jgi:hypothetical protein
LITGDFLGLPTGVRILAEDVQRHGPAVVVQGRSKPKLVSDTVPGPGPPG